MTRQSMSYVLASLERRGYIERHAGPIPQHGSLWIATLDRQVLVD